jgi:cysteinyl-tRNA synthetase
MQEVMKELGFAKNINDFDDYLLEVANRAEKRTYQVNRQALITNVNVAETLSLSKAQNMNTALTLKEIAEGGM